jgi:hypothetical protein
MDAAALARIRLVTSRYVELQGLRTVVAVPACLAAFWMRPFVETLHDLGSVYAWVGFVVSVLPFFAIVASRPLLDRYYAARFGSVATGFGGWSADRIGWTLLFLAAFGLDWSTLGASKPSAILAAGAAIGLHVAWRDWPLRSYYLFTAAACVAGACLVAIVPAFRVDSLDALLRIPFSIVMGAHAAAAVFDHRLLNRVLSRHPQGHADVLARDHADAL